MSTHSKYKYIMTSSVSTFSLLYPEDVPVVTPAPPAAPLPDSIPSSRYRIQLSIQEFTVPGAPRAGYHPTVVDYPGQRPKPVTPVSHNDAALRQLEAQQPIMINLLSGLLEQMESLKDLIIPGHPDDVSQLSYGTRNSNSPRRQHSRERGQSTSPSGRSRQSGQSHRGRTSRPNPHWKHAKQKQKCRKSHQYLPLDPVHILKHSDVDSVVPGVTGLGRCPG